MAAETHLSSRSHHDRAGLQSFHQSMVKTKEWKRFWRCLTTPKFRPPALGYCLEQNAWHLHGSSHNSWFLIHLVLHDHIANSLTWSTIPSVSGQNLSRPEPPSCIHFLT